MGFWAGAFISLDYFECLFFSVEWVVLIVGRLTQCHDMGSKSRAGLWLVKLQEKPGC